MASDALHVIQDLQVKLRRTSQEVQRQKENVAEAEAALRHQAQRHEAARALHEETFRRLQVRETKSNKRSNGVLFVLIFGIFSVSHRIVG